MKEVNRDLNFDFGGMVDVKMVCGGMGPWQSIYGVGKWTKTIQETIAIGRIFWRTLTKMIVPFFEIFLTLI